MAQLFRAKSLARLSSPEQLDKLAHVTSPIGWIAVALTLALTIAAVAWGFLGNISVKVSGPGMIIHRKGQIPLTTVGSGQVSEVFVDVGDMVRAGQIVARIAQPMLMANVVEARGQLAQARDEDARLIEFCDAEAQADRNSADTQTSAIMSYNRSLEQRKVFLLAQLKADQELVRKGVEAPVDVQSTRNELSDVMDTLGQNAVKIAELEATLQSNDHTRRKSLLQSTNNVRSLERALKSRELELALQSQVISDHTGRVVEIDARPGDVVSVGGTILSVADDREKLEAVLYVVARDGKRMSPGMTSNVVPSTVKKEETGSMLGIVTSVAEFPSTREGMMRQLGNESLVDQLSQQGAVIAVHVDLIPNAVSPDGYRWTSSRGGKTRIEPGTLCTAEVSVESKAPASLLMPYIVKWMGL